MDRRTEGRTGEWRSTEEST